MTQLPMPKTFEPMLAKAVDRLPQGDDWAYELKWDGVRAFVHVEGDETRVVSRRGEELSPRYPELAAIGAGVAADDAVLDGEIVAFDDEGKPSFSRLQLRMGLTNDTMIRRRVSEAPVTFVAFDLLWLDGRALLDRPYEERRRLLDGLSFDGPSWQAPRNHLGDGEALLDLVRERRLEGVVAKRLSSPYRLGRRSSEWLKVKCRRRQEVVIGGYMPGEGGRTGSLGSLLVGYWDSTPEEADSLGRPQRFVYGGGVGTGFTQSTLEELRAALQPLRRDTSPFELGWDPAVKYAARVRERGPLVWVEPQLVCEVEFTEWTHEDTLRAASFKGLRDDKNPLEVVREG
jgi:bifunctional non-homologous end joining protein LigD